VFQDSQTTAAGAQAAIENMLESDKSVAAVVVTSSETIDVSTGGKSRLSASGYRCRVETPARCAVVYLEVRAVGDRLACQTLGVAWSSSRKLRSEARRGAARGTRCAHQLSNGMRLP